MRSSSSLLIRLSGLSGALVIVAGSWATLVSAADPAPAPVPISTRPLPGLPASAVAGLDCLIEPNLMVELSTSVSGILRVVNVDRGQIIRSGQVLAQLESEVEKANVARERARADFAAKKSRRMQELLKEQMVSVQQAEEAKADSDLAAAELRKAIEILNQRTVVSPFNGVVVDRFVSPGELVENKKILKVAQINPLNVEVIAPIAMLRDFRIGMPMQVNPEGPAAGPYIAKVRLVDRVIDAPSGTFRVRLALPNPKNEISAGVRCKASMVAPAPKPVAKAKKPVKQPATKPKADHTTKPDTKPKESNSADQVAESPDSKAVGAKGNSLSPAPVPAPQDQRTKTNAASPGGTINNGTPGEPPTGIPDGVERITVPTEVTADPKAVPETETGQQQAADQPKPKAPPKGVRSGYEFSDDQ